MLIALLTVLISLALAMPAGYALARLRLPLRGACMLLFLLPQAFPSLPVYMNIARIFYGLGLNGTVRASSWSTPSTGSCCGLDRGGRLRRGRPRAGAGGAQPRRRAARTFVTVTLPLAAPGIAASAIFVFLESLDEFTGTYFVGVPDVTTLPLLLFNASMGGNYQVASITALILLVPSVGFMLVIERFLRAEVLAKVGG